MTAPDLSSRLRFYFIVDCDSPLGLEKQVEIAISAGATMVQYRNKHFHITDFIALTSIRRLCRINRVPFIVNDDILLARAVDADGVHLGQSDERHATARWILGGYAIIGASVSTTDALLTTDLSNCDYIGTGPVFHTSTKADADPVIGLEGLARVVRESSLPVVAIGGIDSGNAGSCFSSGANGVAVISTITRADDPLEKALSLGAVCGSPRRDLKAPWKDEFELIDQILAGCQSTLGKTFMKIPPGDDASLFKSIEKPVFTTDTQREGVHFRSCWQEMDEIGKRAVEITLSDLAASYAKPVGLFVNLCVPADIAMADVIELYRGIDAALMIHNAELGGGNVSVGPVLALDLFAAGEGSDIFPLRSAATPGDGLYATGPLGLARSGLECLAKGDFSFPGLIEKYKSPKARFDAAAVLFSHGVMCVMDISDGLYGDASHIASASGASIRFEPSNMIIDDRLAAYCDKYGLDPVSQILAGGDDYELLFACREDVFAEIASHLPEAHPVGCVVPRAGRLCIGVPEGTVSYRHGQSFGPK